MAQTTLTSNSKTSALGPLAATVLAMLFGLLAAVAVNAQPRDPSRVAAIFPPWWTASQTLTAAGAAGDVAAAGGTPFILILRGDPADLAQRARSAGALLVLDPDLAGVCAPKDARP
mgnify:CR=1 FL=1